MECDAASRVGQELLARAVRELGYSLGLRYPRLEQTPEGYAVSHHGMTQYPRINAHVRPIPLELCDDHICLRLAENLKHCIRMPALD
jgi:hypothetical protein